MKKQTKTSDSWVQKLLAHFIYNIIVLDILQHFQSLCSKQILLTEHLLQITSRLTFSFNERCELVGYLPCACSVLVRLYITQLCGFLRQKVY